MIEMPVLFWDYGRAQGLPDLTGARALTNNVVNSIVHGDKIIVADVAGPNVGGATGDIFDFYVEEAAKLVGFTTVEKTVETYYHNLLGSIHCGTNVIREIEDKWWENL